MERAKEGLGEGLDGADGASGQELVEVGVLAGIKLGLGALPLYLSLVEEEDAECGAAEGAVLVGNDDVAARGVGAFLEGLD